MRVRDVPSHVERAHGFPITEETLRSEFGSVPLDVPGDGEARLASLLDACAEGGFPGEYASTTDLRSALLSCADRTHVGRPQYDDRGGNPGRDPAEQVSF
jgi:hypothetical protein